jgi:KDO2-lipid IV(A) lauroyltransferase
MSSDPLEPVPAPRPSDGPRPEVGGRETARERLAYHLYATGEWLAASLPERLGRALFERLGAAAHRWAPRTRATVTANLAQVLGRPPDSELVEVAVRESFVRYARYWFDTFRLRVLPAAELDERFRVEGLEHLDAALEDGRGAIAVLPHMGNWDAGGAWLAAHGYRLASVAERLRPDRLARLFLLHRAELGMRILPLSGNGVGSRLTELLADNWIVALVADRDLSGRGVEVEMFGRPRRLPAGPALLAVQTGAPLLVCPVYGEDGGWRCVIGRPLEVERTGRRREDVAALTVAMGAAFERAIAASPTDWHMFQPAWDA